MRIFQKRDEDFDLCKVFLLIVMFSIHTFQCFYCGPYNGHVTYFVTIGFVFLAGFTLPTASGYLLRRNTAEVLPQIYQKALKLIGLFILSNAAVITYDAHRFAEWERLSLREATIAAILLKRQDLFSFDVLIPIALSFLLAPLVMPWIRRSSFLMVATILSYLFLFTTEVSGFWNYYGIKLTLVGVIGYMASLWVWHLDWDMARRHLRNASVLLAAIGLFLAFYFAFFIFFTPHSPISVSIHLGPTFFILLAVYMLSLMLGLSDHPGIRYLNRILARQMLFAYLFHILLLNLLLSLIPLKSLPIGPTAILAAGVLLATAAACAAMAQTCQRMPWVNGIYRLVFK